MKKVLVIVDSIQYITTNCFQHQLFRTLKDITNFDVIEIGQITTLKKEYDVIISLLKQRTIVKNIEQLFNIFNKRKINVYDQDPWEAYYIGAQYKGSYDLIASKLNVKFFITTKWWANYVRSKGHNVEFVKMGVLPEYCIDEKQLAYPRKYEIAFIGTVHSYRQRAIDELKQYNINVSILQSVSDYKKFLTTLRDIKVYFHCEDKQLVLDDCVTNLNNGLWIKDIEACSQGCYSIRNFGPDSESYLSDVDTCFTYNSIEEVPILLNKINDYDVELVSNTVKHIKQQDNWHNTAISLINN